MPTAFHADDKRFAKKVVELKLADRETVKEAARIVALRADVGEMISLEQVMFERDLLSAAKVIKVQKALSQRSVFCPGCQERLNLFKDKPGSKVKCPTCKNKVPVPGGDPKDPFKTSASAVSTRTVAATADSGGGSALGVLVSLAALALLGDAAWESRASHMFVPAAGCAGGFFAVAALLGRKLGALTTASLGVATVTGLVVSYAIGNTPGSRALVAFEHDAHLALAPLVLLQLLVALIAGHGLLIRARAALLVLLLPLVWGLLYFTWRSVPSTDPSAWLSGGPELLSRLPWYAHPGVVTLLLVFPVAAGLFLCAGLKGLFQGQPGLLLRRGGVAACLLFLAGFGLTVGTASGRIPDPELQRQVQTALAGRVSAFWQQAHERAPVATVAAAITPSEPTR